MFKSDQFLVEKKGHVVVCTMNRPEKKNAFGLEMLVAMHDAWAMCDEDLDVRAIVLTGAGGNFCAGSDLKENQLGQGQGPAEELKARLKADPRLHWKSLLKDSRPQVPVIAAVEGFALAGGTEILQGTDIRIAGKSAMFGVTEAALGLFPMGGSSVRLLRQIGWARASEMLLAGRRVDAVTAERWGLINEVVEDGKALETAMAMAERVAACGPLAVRAIKASMLMSEARPEKDTFAEEEALAHKVFASEDAKEGPTAFFQKRKPEFKGR